MTAPNAGSALSTARNSATSGLSPVAGSVRPLSPMPRTIRVENRPVIVRGADFRVLPGEEARPFPGRMTWGFASPTLHVMRGPHAPTGKHGQPSATAGVKGVDLDWPWYIPLGAAGSAVAAAVGALAQRDAFSPPSYEILVALFAVSPWLVEHLTEWAPPRVLMAIVATTGVAVLLVANPQDIDFAPFILVWMAAEAGATGNHWEGAAAVGMAVGLMIGLEVTHQFSGGSIWAAGSFAGWGMGHGMQGQMRLQAEEQARQADRLEKAATDERQRIAREVHDVIAHSLSVTMLHLTGARRALETGAAPAEAAEALRDAERLGRQAMNDIRRTVGLLAPEAAGETAPMPGVVDIPALVAEFASAGLDVTCEVEGDPAAVSLAAGLGLYRIAQESLSNIARHAPGVVATVRLDLSGDDVGLAVHNARGNGAPPLEGAPDMGGLGVRGMEERARLLGGSFRAGPADGGWVVEVRVPREPAPDE